MFKIYIKNITIKNVENNLESLKKYLNKTYSFMKLHDTKENELYEIINNDIYFIETINDKDKLIKEYNIILNNKNVNILLDDSKEERILIYSQLPFDYKLQKITRYEYNFNNLTLVIEGIWEKKEKKEFKKNNILDIMKQTFTVIDFYFIKKDLNINFNKDVKHENKNEKKIDLKNETKKTNNIEYLHNDLNVFLSCLI
jgi:hypothetical protein